MSHFVTLRVQRLSDRNSPPPSKASAVSHNMTVSDHGNDNRVLAAHKTHIGSRTPTGGG
jgi:hypothetical protein